VKTRWSKVRKSLLCHSFVMFPKYIDDDKKEGVNYLSPIEQQQSRLVIRNGLIYKHDGVTLLHTVDTRECGEYKVAALYVVDLEGHFYALKKSHDTKKIKHSSILAGKSVLSAGYISVAYGKLAYISNASGHYQPTLEALFKTIYLLRKSGVKLDSFEVRYVSPASLLPIKYITALHFLKDVEYPKEKSKPSILLRRKPS
jgi:hypothetical protein